ncbi:TetR/AcrR family transcriptional regulator [Vibrio kyushuensis]|uniref:TetR/AcrR family transcriptional regulator n=1 Tax=Vibrio kyushuensis TaxID=2910249 RepID=UPI003D14CDC4
MSKREISMAKSKLKVLTALLDEMKEEDFEVIKISSLCESAAVSQASFYNYFPQKTDILVYYIQLWAVEMYWRTSVEKKLHGLNAIRHLFNQTAGLCVSHSNLLTEIISLQVKTKKIVNKNPLTAADKLVSFPNLCGIESVVVQDLKDILSIYVKQATDNQELPKSSNVTTLITSLSAIFFTVPILFNQCSEEAIKEAFDNQLNLFMYGAASHGA